MTSLLEGATTALRRSFCAATSTLERWTEIYYPTPILGDYPIGARQFASRLFCDREPPTLPGGVAGGQCLVSYTIVIRWRATAIPGSGLPDENSTDTIVFTGAFNGVSVVHDSGRFYAELRAASIPIVSGASTYRYRSVSDGFYTGATTEIISLTRDDGLPDNCGSVVPAPPVPVPPTGTGDPVSITYNNDEGDTINLNGTVVFAPVVVNVSGNLIVPFSLNLNANFNIPINGSINLTTGDINLDFGGNGQGNESSDCKDPTKLPPAEPEPPDASDPPVAPPPLNPEDPDAPKRKLLRGVVCYVSGDSSRVTTVSQPNTTPYFAPRCGNVRFLLQVGNSVVWSQAIPVQGDRELVRCDWEGGALDVRVDPYAGFDIALQRVYYQES